MRSHLPVAIPVLAATAVAALAMSGCGGHGEDRSAGTGSLAQRALEWPSPGQLRDVLFLKSYNTRIVVIGTMLLGTAAGMTGSFALLRRRALMGDALSHATLPGIAIAYMAATLAGGDGKSSALLLTGATISGLCGVGAILAIRRLTRLKEDAAMGIVLSCFFGAGIALLGIIQTMPGGHAAGLEGFILGKTASMVAGDAWLIAVAAAISICFCLLLFKELRLLCFDEGFAGSRGFPVVMLDFCLMALIILVTIVGLQAVGLILMIALLVIPPAAARFWSNSTWRLFLLSGVIGGLSGYLGAVASALFGDLPSGAMIVLVCAGMFGVSMIFGSRRGVLQRTLMRYNSGRSVDRQHLLRAIYEASENSAGPATGTATTVGHPVPVRLLLQVRSWSAGRLDRAIRRAVRNGHVVRDGDFVSLTRPGFEEAVRLTRQHRLWELYLIRYAEVAASRVDRDADAIEHVLEPHIVDELEAMLERDSMPESPHVIPLATPTGKGGGRHATH
jgi:manganese/zinc/iron transport system permease protein